MAPDEIAGFLRGREFMVVGTQLPGGWPHLTTVRYGWLGDRVAFQGYTKSQKFVNLKRDPHVSALVEAPGDYDEIKGVLLLGVVHLQEDPDLVVEVMKSSLEQSPTALANTEVASLEAIASKRTVATIEPERVITWDHTRLGGRY